METGAAANQSLSGKYAPLDPFEMKSKQQNMTPKVFTEGISAMDEKFKAKFEEPHRRLKASIHRCQAHAYSKQGLSLA